MLKMASSLKTTDSASDTNSFRPAPLFGYY